MIFLTFCCLPSPGPKDRNANGKRGETRTSFLSGGNTRAETVPDDRKRCVCSWDAAEFAPIQSALFGREKPAEFDV